VRLKTRFRISAVASFGAVLLLAAVLVGSLRETRRAEVEVDLARSITKEQYERSLLRDDYLLSPGLRARRQWEGRTASLTTHLAQAATEYDTAGDRRLVAEMTSLLRRTSAGFREIVRLDDQPPAGALQLALAAELRGRSAATLRMDAHDLYARASQLEFAAHARLRATHRRTTLIMVSLLGAVFLVTFFNVRMALVTLERRVTRLHDGAEQVARGNLDHRIGIRGDDELAELGATFDRMTVRLRQTHAAMETSNRELEAFSYAVSHDLRAPLRSVSGFSQAVLEDYGPQLDAKGRQYLEMAAEAARDMGQLIDDLLGLSRVSRVDMVRRPVDLSALARSVLDELRNAEPDRRVEVEVSPELSAEGDPTLLRFAMENLVRNAWKFTSRHETARIAVGRVRDRGCDAFFVADDGAGFDMAFVDKLFNPFQRLHRTSEFEGTGIGLATVRRVVRRHGGEAWARGEVEKGATIFFTLPAHGGPDAEQGHSAGRGQPEGRAPDGAGLQAEQDRERAAGGE
jgi:signal transduction histidine kinase